MQAAEEDSEEVVLEGDVFLSKALAENLYVFQYPTNTADSVEKTDEESNCLSARIKPKQQKVEMELGINIHSDSYDRGRGERIACDVDGKDNANNAFFQSEYMDKYIMQGSKSVVSPESYGLGIMRKGELHLVPIHSVISMTPHCVHIDKMDSQAKKVNPVDEEEEEEAVAVTVRFEGANTDKNKEYREKTHQYYQHMNASEQWINLDFHPFNSDRSKLECQKLFCTDSYKENVNELIDQQDYLQNLVPSHLQQSSHQEVRDDRFMKDKPVSDQIKYLLTNAHLLTYAMLVKKLTCKVDEVTVERLLNQFAVLVRGCWAVKSELLYPENYVSAFTGVNSKTLVNTRDYILWLYTKSAVITRQEVLSVIQIPGVDFKSMIAPIAVEVDRCWEFKFPEDKDFIDSHAEVNERQNMKWDLRYKKLVKDLNIGMQELEGLTTSPSKVPPYAITRPRQKRHSRSSISEGDESGTDSAHGTKENNKSKRSCSFKRNISANPSSLNSKSKSHYAALDISPTYLENTLPANIMAELKEYVGDIMRTQYCMTLKDIKELVSQSHLSGIANRSDFQKLVELALVESGAQELKNKWPQNAVPETLYAFAKFDNKLDRYRNALLDLFCSVARTRMNMLVKKVEDELREIVSESDCRLLFEEYCVHKSGFYYLKGTIALDS